MGLGLKTALTDWESDRQNDATAVLMTDGMQNTPPSCIVPDGQTGCFVSDGGVNWKFDGDPAPIYKLGIPIDTVAMGTPDQVPFDILDGLALETTGIHVQTATSATAGTAFRDLLVATLKGNTMSVLSQTTGTISSSAASSPTSQFLVDGSVKRAILVVDWQGERNSDALDLKIIPPGGCSPATATNGPVCNSVPPVQRVDGQFWTAQAVDIPASGPIGDWGVQVIRKKPIGEDISAMAVPYQLSIYSVDGRLKYRLNFPPKAIGTGDSILLQLEASYDGKPLPGLGNAIHVQVERPNTGLGTVLHNTSVSNDVLSTEIFSNDHTAPYERKVLYLSRTAGLAAKVEPVPVPTDYVLLDDGGASSGDAVANDGVYSVKIGDTTRPGLYRFRVTMNWDNPTTGKIHRIELLERQVKVNPDAGASIVNVARGTTAGEWLIKVEPIDKFGNYLGPGVPAQFQVQVTGGGSVAGLPGDDQQTGAYVIKLVGVPAGADPMVSIKVADHEIRNGKLSKIGKAKGCLGLHFATALYSLPVGILIIGVFVYLPRIRKRKL